MKSQYVSDKFAMGLSLACVLHCFFVPSFLIITSGMLSVSLDNEFVHKLLVLVAVPISSFALIKGYKYHKTFSFISFGILGLVALILAVLLGESNLGELGEKGLTLLGSILVAYSHFKNYKMCIELDCSCHDN
ncbi:MAG: MerC mercury resistance protein [Woeseiaceae bacterium]|nr:MerC mercury resistance protein [Woeseiaceae bacterium]